MRILFVNDTGTIAGGSQTYLASVKKELEQRNHQVKILSSNERNNPWMANETFQQIPKRSWKRFFYRINNPAARNALSRIIKKWKPNVVHFNYVYNEVSVGAMRIVSTPSVVSLHDNTMINPFTYPIKGSFIRKQFWKAYLKIWHRASIAALKRVNYCIAPSAYVMNIAQKAGLRNVVRLPFGARQFKATPLKKTHKIFAVGNIIEEKGFQYLIQALPAIRKIDKKANIVIAGSGNYKDDLIKLAIKLGVKKYVQFIGAVPQSELQQLYAEANIVVVPSIIPESFNLVRIEAMSAGRPVIVSTSGAAAEGLTNNIDALIVPPANSKAIATAVSSLLKNSQQSKAIALAGKKTARQYTMKAHVNSLVKLYREAIGRR